MKVIDVGCGAGKDLSRLESMVESIGEVVGLDISKEMVECANARMSSLPNVSVLCANATAIPFAEDYFDACRCERLLQHVPQPSEVIEEMVRVTKTGGRISITDIDWWSSTISMETESGERINNAITRGVVFNPNPSVGRHIRAHMSRTKKIVELDMFAQCLFTDTLAQADELLWLGERGKMAVQQNVISEDDYILWRQELEKMEEEGSFVFTINLYTVSGTISK
ncbi:hypothetical protein SAMD00019534_053710 [Acytostelium subglobosum LB1]|uniref:hypothetical protein n=1 Tax=Acytostelium subglobosum LB1 TaxID=1410327 RepID=UPI000644C812|nr:hypothetical protein SAMD00019534_053710 [Acytostelium subglobosum LB1]GAM22196.1 hypothetical protein SAMD00019534_053710 [Acytostelium subglobosum LB1]|eukprot:XP_012755296.1 hypothetical protein SAMD00019534_053710 [Acytostelium subglobosum LB1]